MANKVTKAQAVTLASLFKAMGAIPATDPRVATLLLKVKEALRSVDVTTKGVRLDLRISLPDGRTILCDFSGIHPTTIRAMAVLSSFNKANRLGQDATTGPGDVILNNPMAREPSPAVAAATKLKITRYLMLMELLLQQVHAHKRPTLPKLVPGIITHLGEMGPEMIELVETLTGVAGSRFKRSPLTMGLSKTKITAIFRTKFKDALMAANAQGFGRALMAAGNPIAG